MVTGAMNVNTESGCSRATDPDMTSSCSFGQDVTKALGGNKNHPDHHGPGSEWPLDTNVTTFVCLGPEHLCDLWW